MGTHPIFESDFDCLTDSINLFYYEKLVFQKKSPQKSARRTSSKLQMSQKKSQSPVGPAIQTYLENDSQKLNPKSKKPVVEEPKVVSKIQQSKDLVKYYYGLLLIQLVALKNLLLMSLERSNAALKSSSQKLKTLISRKPVVENIPPVEEEIKKEENKEEPTETRKPSIVETLMTNLKLKSRTR